MCLLEIGTCNIRARNILVIQTFFIMFTSSLKIKSYPMSWCSDIAVASEIRNSYIILSKHSTLVHLKSLEVP